MSLSWTSILRNNKIINIYYLKLWAGFVTLDNKEVKSVNPEGNQPWILIGRTDAEAEVLILWPPDVKHWLIGKYTDTGKDWGQKEKGAKEDEMFGLHHWLNEHELEQTLGDDEGQGRLACCTPWDHKELDVIERLSNNHHHRELIYWGGEWVPCRLNCRISRWFGSQV